MILSILIWCLAGSPVTEIRGRVSDESGAPIPYAHVMTAGRGTSCDASGRFFLRIGPGPHVLTASAMGYASRSVDVAGSGDSILIDIKLAETPLTLQDAVVIYGKRDHAYSAAHKRNSIDDHFREVDGVHTLRRANFASEPVIRGYSADRISIVVDGVSVQSACVDKMDPVSAYVETENLDRMEIDKSGFDLSYGRQIGGTVNLVPEKPALDQSLSVRSSVSYEHASSLKRMMTIVQRGGKQWAFRLSASGKRAGDYRAGGGRRISNSGYDKVNVHAGVLVQPSARRTLDFSAIVDGAWDIGYPSMIMDTRRTKAVLVNVQYTERPRAGMNEWNVRWYASRIEHWMDDDDRDVTQRDVMPGMHMPMFGRTATIGGRAEAIWLDARRLFKVALDGHRVGAFADMRMDPIDPDVADMALVNLSDVADTRASLTLDWRRRLGAKWEWRVSVRGDVIHRDPSDGDGIRSLRIFYPTEDLSWTHGSISAGSQWTWEWNAAQRLTFGLSRRSRAPTMIETHGYFLYNAQDGRIYVGNPGLSDEVKTQVEVQWQRTAGRVQSDVALYVHEISNYIIGRPWDDEYYTYAGLRKARMIGTEAWIDFQWSGAWTSKASVTAMRGTNRDDGEPLPQITPVQGTVSLRWKPVRHRHDVIVRWAAPQRRVSSVAREDRTAGYWTLEWNATVRLSDRVELRTGVENIFDRRYHDHLSFNNLPAGGRNIYAGLDVRF
jgi:iron complex outermembrane receptor protein